MPEGVVKRKPRLTGILVSHSGTERSIDQRPLSGEPSSLMHQLGDFLVQHQDGVETIRLEFEDDSDGAFTTLTLKLVNDNWMLYSIPRRPEIPSGPEG